MTHDHQHYVDRSNHEVDHRMRNNGRVREVVTRNVNVYNTRYREFTHERYEYYNHCTVDRHLRYDGWRYYGFYGGYWWTWGSYYDVSDYYWNPMVFWFYTDDWDYYYYHRWYRHHFRHYPELQERFLYAGDYFPTEAFRDLLLDMSGRSIDQQIGFRRAMNIVTEQLETQLDPAGPVAFERNEIVVTHFELLGYDGVELEGFASHGQVQAPFKMVLDLNNPGMSLVFVPHSESVAAGDPQLESLSALNARIVELGGTVSVETPAPAPAPVPAPVQ